MCARIFSRGFHGPREDTAEGGCLPRGQYLVTNFPVLFAGPTPHTKRERSDRCIPLRLERP